MEGVVALILLVVVLVGLGLVTYSYYLQLGLTTTGIALAQDSYSSLQGVINVSNSSIYSCTSSISTFSVSGSGIISIPSQVSTAKAVSYTGGIPAEKIIYYSNNRFFILSPYPIVTGNFTNSRICFIPSIKTFEIK